MPCESLRCGISAPKSSLRTCHQIMTATAQTRCTAAIPTRVSTCRDRLSQWPCRLQPKTEYETASNCTSCTTASQAPSTRVRRQASVSLLSPDLHPIVIMTLAGCRCCELAVISCSSATSLSPLELNHHELPVCREGWAENLLRRAGR